MSRRSCFLVLGLALGACRREVPVAPPRDPERPDVVFVVLDTLRADHLSDHGYPLPTSTGVDAFIAQSTAFTKAHSTAPWTLPSTTTLLTGLSPARHKLIRYGDVLPAEVETFAERMKGGTWKTAAISFNEGVSRKTGLAQGFDHFETFDGDVLDYPDISEMLPKATDWVDDNAASPFFLYLQPMNCHGPYHVPDAHLPDLLGHAPIEGFRYFDHTMSQIMMRRLVSERSTVSDTYVQSLREQYDTAVRYSLDQVGQLFEALKARGLYDGALIVLTADHGEELFDHGGFSHGFSLYEEVLHVPLYVKLPHQTEAHRVDTELSTIDLVPTLLDTLGLPADDLDGRSLAPALRGEPIPEEEIAVSEVSWPQRCIGRTILEGRYKYVEIDSNYEGVHRAHRLYDLQADPAEVHDLYSLNRELAGALRNEMFEHINHWRKRTDYVPKNASSSMDQERLKALGYTE